MKLTILLTIKDRVAFTYRWMQYMNDFRCPYRILIADGGKDKEVELHLRCHSHYPNLDYEYIRYPFDAVVDDYFVKLENVISRVDTEYILLADDDDFYLLERIKEMTAFLDQHKDYVGVRGEQVALTVFDKAGLPTKLPQGERYLAVSHAVPSIENECRYARVEMLCGNMNKYYYYANWYSVFRADALQEVWKYLVKSTIKEVIVTEMLTHILMVMKGKVKVLPFPFYVRQSQTSMGEDTLVVGNGFLQRAVISNFLSEFGITVDEFVEPKTRAERDRLLRAVATWLEVFVSNIYWYRVRSESSRLYFLREVMKNVLLRTHVTCRLYFQMSSWFSPSGKKYPVRLRRIEPYII